MAHSDTCFSELLSCLDIVCTANTEGAWLCSAADTCNNIA